MVTLLCNIIKSIASRGCYKLTAMTWGGVSSTPGRIFAFTSDLVKIRPGIDCVLENMPPSLTNRAHEVSLAFQLINTEKK